MRVFGIPSHGLFLGPSSSASERPPHRPVINRGPTLLTKPSIQNLQITSSLVNSLAQLKSPTYPHYLMHPCGFGHSLSANTPLIRAPRTSRMSEVLLPTAEIFCLQLQAVCSQLSFFACSPWRCLSALSR